MKKDIQPKVLFVTRKFPPSVGGMENFANDLYNALIPMVSIKLIKWGGSNILLLPIIIPYLFTKSFFILLRYRVDVIHMQDGVMSFVGVVLKVVFRKPLIVVIHGLDVTHNNIAYQWFIKRSLMHADGIVCISRAAADEVVKRGIDQAKVHVVTLGINPLPVLPEKVDAIKRIKEDYKIDLRGRRVVLSVGRFVERKGVAWFIKQVLPSLVEEDPSTVFIVSGDGVYREGVEKAIVDSSLEKIVFLFGRTTEETLNNMWAVADVFVMPNIRVKGDMEGFGIVLLEASWHSIPVVASALEGILDATKDGGNAVHVRSEDSDEFYQAVKHILVDRRAAQRLGNDFHNFTKENYSWQGVAKQYLTYYHQVIDTYK